MEIQLKDLHPNPFRNIERYKIDRDKVDALKTSIEETTFWDNILARPDGNGGYELAYGHHRQVGLQELGFKTIDIPIRDLDDSTMLRIMANENLSDWATTPAVINETVFAAKAFLDGELGKIKSLNMAQGFLSQVLPNDKSFANAKRDGVGEGIIKKFLGDNWSIHMIREALAVHRSIARADEIEAQREKERQTQYRLQQIQEEEERKLALEKEEKARQRRLERIETQKLELENSKRKAAQLEKEGGDIDRDAYESFDTQAKASDFRKAVKEHKIPKSMQKGLAKEIKTKGISGPSIADRVKQTGDLLHPKQKEFKPTERPHLDKFAEEIGSDATELSGKLTRISNNLDMIFSEHSKTLFYSHLKTLHKKIGEILEKGMNDDNTSVLHPNC